MSWPFGITGCCTPDGDNRFGPDASGVPRGFPGTIGLLDTDQNLDPAGMVKLRPADRPGNGVLLLPAGLTRRPIVIFDPPSVFVQHDMEMPDA